MNKKRFSHIDLIESIAIFIVIFYHSTFYSYDFIQNGSVLNYFLYFGRTILSASIPLFFFANGYLLFNREFDLSKHIRKTFRLIAIMIIWALILVPIYLIIAGEPVKLSTIVISILYQDKRWGMHFYWFIGALICLYLLFPALKALFDSNRRAFVFFTAAIAVLTLGHELGNQLLAILGPLVHRDLKSLNYPMITMFNPFRGAYGYSYVSFCTGGLIYTYEEPILSAPSIKRNTVAILGIFISNSCLFAMGVFFSKYYEGKLWDGGWNSIGSIFSYFNAIFIYVLCLNYRRGNRFISTISRNTLGIFFTHELFIRLTIQWVKEHKALCNMPVNLIYAFAVMCGSLLVCLLLKRIPLLNKLI